ncbi:SDR family oxidoreductase [SAR202 cluster bacterium AD-802-E10_MRT_200m]|nr:SDR family oxidoreductase [SAR202 cluster bacterium AD-802-E10_MRT_200m]
MDLGLQDRVAIVTGGSDGIGKATALRLAKEGARVAICARRQEVLETTAQEIRVGSGQEIFPVVTDIGNVDDIKNLVKEVVKRWNRVDILVNNAGTSAAGSFETVSDEAWMTDLNVKLFGAIRCIREVLPFMKQQHWGRIINVTNLGAKAPGARSVPTSVSRAAGVALTKALSKEYAADNILVNTVLIGLIKAGQHELRLANAQKKDSQVTLEEFYGQMGESIPLGRVGESSEAADVISFLVSERASYLTGVAVNIDGGTSPVV